jgi:hypothetical protein
MFSRLRAHLCASVVPFLSVFKARDTEHPRIVMDQRRGTGHTSPHHAHQPAERRKSASARQPYNFRVGRQ